MHLRTVICIAGVSLGIVVGYHSRLASELGMAALVLGMIELILFLLARKRGQRGVALSLYLSLLAFGFFVGVVRTELIEEPSSLTCETSCTFNARVLTSPERKDTYQLFTIRPVAISDPVYAIQVRSPLYPRVRRGEIYAFVGKVTLPTNSYPHEKKSTFEYVSYLRTHDVGSEMIFPHMTLVDQNAHTVADLLGRWKEDLVQQLATYVVSPASHLAAGMLFGDASLPSDAKESFRVAGLSHIIVLSGFNIAIVISFMLLLFRFLPLVLRVALAMFFTCMFVMMVGAEASVVRATLMACIGLLAMVLGRQYTARQSLVLSFLAISMYDPFLLEHDVSLHLSFLATAGIIYLGEPFLIFFGRYIQWSYVRELLSTTFAAYISTLPYLAYTFGSMSMYALVANMLVLPFVPIVMILSVCTIMASYVHPYLALLSGWLVSLLGMFIMRIAEVIENLPYATVAIPGWLALSIAIALGTGIISFTRNGFKNETSETTKDGYLTDVIAY